MSEIEPGPERSGPRRWVTWGTVGVVAALAVAGAVIAVPLLRPASAPAASPSAEAPSPSATPSQTPSPSPTPTATCTVTSSSVTWSDPMTLDLPADGAPIASPVQQILRADVDYRPQPGPFAIDDERFGIITYNDLTNITSLTVAGRTGSEVWTAEIDGSASLLSSPATTGVPDRIIVAVNDGDFDNGEPGDHRIRVFDLATGDVLDERGADDVYAVTPTASRASAATVAPTTADVFYVGDRETLSRIDGATLEPQWSVSGADFGVDHFEGGVPFWVTGDVVFVGSHALDAETGEALGWESAGAVFHAAGVTLQTPMMYDHVGTYELSGLDTALGQACWTREVQDVAADADTLWVLTPAGTIEHIDPLTGATLDTIAETAALNIGVAGRFLVTAQQDPDDYTAPVVYTVYDASGSLGTFTTKRSGRVYASGDQIMHFDYGTNNERRSLTAYDTPIGEPAWRIDGIDLMTEAGVVLRAAVDWDGNIVEFELLH